MIDNHPNIFKVIYGFKCIFNNLVIIILVHTTYLYNLSMKITSDINYVPILHKRDIIINVD